MGAHLHPARFSCSLWCHGVASHAGHELLRVGATVSISGLKARPDLNGTHGKVTAKQGERWGVKPEAGGTPVALKPAALTVVCLVIQPAEVCGYHLAVLAVGLPAD